MHAALHEHGQGQLEACGRLIAATRVDLLGDVCWADGRAGERDHRILEWREGVLFAADGFTREHVRIGADLAAGLVRAVGVDDQAIFRAVLIDILIELHPVL